MNLNKVLNDKQKKILEKNKIEVIDKELEENEIILFCKSLFKHELTQEQQEDIFDTIDDYEGD